MRVVAALLCVVSQQAWMVNANVEKTIFLGPSAVTLPDIRPSLEDLRLHSLSNLEPILPTQLPVQFPSHTNPHGIESWYLLSGLEEGRRYEVRICWPATSPTDFWLDTYSIAQVFDTPNLISSLASYSEQLAEPHLKSSLDTQRTLKEAQSILFLRVQAAASYYSTNRSLMERPPLVDVDIILDPFLLNVLPRSLVPVAIYITAVAVAAWFISGYLYRWLLSVVEEPREKPHAD
ncbi:uncharacterized protein EKO05_0008553 [Ascochyta rabiei]|uniref:Uncharacterized protein n=1 Tax=Didymella rabiei TaxID=5454 RepID=A0A163MMP5_DIDRA|nr:uncharacterized protein EKO05_0008553 [Ascochyta rabiei]KZM28848.1 hypothetical protein ST47_g31 [Ascochyta rabiei]UPX18246.1 hypothetical protein EKO05_0008553 [Ascochyta rabiei]